MDQNDHEPTEPEIAEYDAMDPHRRICYHGLSLFGVVAGNGQHLMAMRLFGHPWERDEDDPDVGPADDISEYVMDARDCAELINGLTHGYRQMAAEDRARIGEDNPEAAKLLEMISESQQGTLN
jgi:hypothetical protein